MSPLCRCDRQVSLLQCNENYNILRQLNPNRVPLEAMTYKNNATNSFDMTSSCIFYDAYSMVIYVVLHL